MASIRPRKTQDGVTWQVRFRAGTKELGESFLNENDALDFKNLVEDFGPATALRILEAKQKADTGTHTVNSWLDTYLDPDSGQATGITESTRNGYRNIAKNAIRPYLGQYPLTALERPIIGAWVAWLEKMPSTRTPGKTISAKTIANYQGFLSTVLQAAVDAELIPKNPAKGVELSDGERREPVFLTYEQFTAILNHMPDQYRTLARFLVGTGLRWSEATALTWADINANATPPTVRVNKAWKRTSGGWKIGTPKSKKSRRTVSLGGDLVHNLGARGKPTDLVFTSATGNRIYNSNFRERAWLPAVNKAYDDGILSEKPTVHDLRHTHASWLIERGVPLPFIQARLGHESITTTVDVYGHLQPDAHLQMAQVMTDVMVEQPSLDPTAVNHTGSNHAIEPATVA